jgi:hypothetical protein
MTFRRSRMCSQFNVGEHIDANVYGSVCKAICRINAGDVLIMVAAKSSVTCSSHVPYY